MGFDIGSERGRAVRETASASVLIKWALTLLLFTSSMSHAQQGVHTPAPGSPERKSIMYVLRLSYYKDAVKAHRNPEEIFFVVRFLKVNGDWALTCYDPVHADGKTFTEPYWWTLLHRKSGHWTDANYFDAILRYPVDNDFDAIDMSPIAIHNIQRAFPDVPKDIFPDRKK